MRARSTDAHVRLAFFSRLSSGFVGCAGILVLLGWMLDIESLKRVIPGLVSMNPVTALAFLLAAVALWLLHKEPSASVRSRPIRKVGRFCALMVLCIGAVKFTSCVSGWDIGIDQILFAGKLDGDQPQFPNRMAPNTALNFVLAGLSLLFLDIQTPRARRPAQYFAAFLGLISLLALIGYAYDVKSFHGVVTYIPMAFHSAAAFVVLAFGIFCVRPHVGMMSMFTSMSAGGQMVRRLLPGTIVVLVGVGWLRLEGERRGLYNADLGVTLYTTVTLAIFVILICSSAESLHRSDLDRMRVEAERERIFTLSLDMLCIAGFDGYFKRLNPAWEKTLGFTREELTSKPFLDFVLPEDREKTIAAAQTISRGTELLSFENRYLCKDGSYRWLLWSATPWSDEQLIYAAARDITERKRTEKQIDDMNQALALRASELDLANKELEAFSYSVSHDLRAPLRHTAGFVELLKKHAGPTLDDKGQRYLKILSESTTEMSHLIDDLLSFSRMGRAEMRATRVDLEELMEDTIRSFDHETEGRDVVWKIGALPEIEADPSLLRQVAVNLLSNALKYSRTRKRTEIEIGAQSGGHGEHVFFVRDNGVGFDMQYASKLFGVFQRLHESEEFEGTGIGLANVQRIISRHRGRTWAESAVDQGATFYFSLPKSQQIQS